MADTKISALSAASAAASTNELAINEAGTSKKLTVAQLVTYLKTVGFPITKALGSDITGINSTTMAKATNIDQTVSAGLWQFEYHINFTSNTTSIGMRFGVNFSGTQTMFVTEGTQFESTTAASTGATSQAHTAGFGLRSGGTGRAPSTTNVLVMSTAVDATTDMYVVIRGLMNVTVSGDLQLYYGSEVTGGTQVLKSFTSLIATKIG